MNIDGDHLNLFLNNSQTTQTHQIQAQFYKTWMCWLFPVGAYSFSLPKKTQFALLVHASLGNLQQLHMPNLDDQKIFDVLNLEASRYYELLVHTSENQITQEISLFMNIRDNIKDQIQDLTGTAESQETGICDEEMEDEVQEKNYLNEQQSEATPITEDFGYKIEFSEEKQHQRDLVYNGYHYETQNIGAHFKTTTCSYLTILLKSQSLDEDQAKAAKEFSQTNGAIEDFNRLFKVQGLRLMCRQYFQSQTFTKNILASGKMDFRSKLAMIRHLEKVRQLTFKQSRNWKLQKQ